MARRLASRIINTDIEAIHGLTTIQGYIPTRSRTAKPSSEAETTLPTS